MYLGAVDLNKPLTIILCIAGLSLFPWAGMAAEYKETPVTNGGVISGKVTFTGHDPAPRSYKIYKDNHICGDGVHKFDFVKVNNGGLQNAVVYLDKVASGKPFPADVGDGEIVQEACAFKPFLGVMRNNAKLVIVNNDSVEHNVHAYELLARGMKTVIKEDQHGKGSSTVDVNLKRGVAMKVECDAHDFMHSYIFTASNPYFAVVDESGAYEIDAVPPGKYSIKAWHGKLKDQESTVEVTAGGKATVDFEFKGRAKRK